MPASTARQPREVVESGRGASIGLSPVHPVAPGALDPPAASQRTDPRLDMIPDWDLATDDGRMAAMRWIARASCAGIITPDAARSATSTVRQAIQVLAIRPHPAAPKGPTRYQRAKAAEAAVNEPADADQDREPTGDGDFERALDAATTRKASTTQAGKGQ